MAPIRLLLRRRAKPLHVIPPELVQHALDAVAQLNQAPAIQFQENRLFARQ